jgi:nucleotide-binding universal stress UspA family protein
MNTQSLLVPLDLTGCADEVVEAAGDLAAKLDARVILLNVVQIPTGVNPYATMMMDDIEWHTAREALDDDARAHLIPLRERLAAKGVKVGHMLAHGDVTTAILHASEEAKCGIIVMGTHGRRGLERMVLGSVAEQVIRRSNCPVLVIRTHNPAAHPGKSETQHQVEAEREG